MKNLDYYLLKLKTALPTASIKLLDESMHHQEHYTAKNDDISHLKVLIEEPSFNDISRIKAHRIIYDILDVDLKDTLHALRIIIQKK